MISDASLDGCGDFVGFHGLIADRDTLRSDELHSHGVAGTIVDLLLRRQPSRRKFTTEEVNERQGILRAR